MGTNGGGGQVTSSEIIIIFLGWPVTSNKLNVIFQDFLRNNKVIVTFLSNDAHLCLRVGKELTGPENQAVDPEHQTSMGWSSHPYCS